MKSVKESQMKVQQKTVLLCVGAVAAVALVAGGILMVVNHKKNSQMQPVETQLTQGTDVFGNSIDTYVGDVGTIKYDMSACASLDEVLGQIKSLEYRTPVGNVVIVDAGKYGQDETADQAIRATFGEDVDQSTAYFVHVRLVQTRTDNPSWINNNVSQSLITLVSYEARMEDGVSTVLSDFRPAYVDDQGRWSLASTGLEDGQVRDVYYVASLTNMNTSNGDLTIAVGPNDEIGLTYYVYSMTYGNLEGRSPAELNPNGGETAETSAVAETTVESTTATTVAETEAEETETTTEGAA